MVQQINEIEELITVISSGMGTLLAFSLLLLGAMILLGIVISIRAIPIFKAMTERKAKEDANEQQRAQRDAENMARLIDFMGRLTVAIDTLATSQRSIEEAGRAQTTILSTLVDETRALRVDMKAWPKLTTVKLRAMREQIKELETSVNLLVVSTDKQRENIIAVEAALGQLVSVVQRLVQEQTAAVAEEKQAA